MINPENIPGPAREFLRHIVLMQGITTDHPGWGGDEFKFLLDHGLIDWQGESGGTTAEGRLAVTELELPRQTLFGPNSNYDRIRREVEFEQMNLLIHPPPVVIERPKIESYKVEQLRDDGVGFSHFMLHADSGWIKERLLEEQAVRSIEEFNSESGDPVRSFYVSINPLCDASQAFAWLNMVVKMEYDRLVKQRAERNKKGD